MRVALITTFAASRKEPLGAVVDRIHNAFLENGLGEAELEFSFGDAPVPGFVSSVDRVVKRFPNLSRFVSDGAPIPGMPAVRRITNSRLSPHAGEQVPYETVGVIAAGVPRSFPFHTFAVNFRSPSFGEGLPGLGPIGGIRPGILVSDSWWVSGRTRSLMAMAVVDGDATSKTLPAIPEALAKIYSVCGKVKSTSQAPFVEASSPEAAGAIAATEGARAVMADYRARLEEVVERARMPHDLPPAPEAMRATSIAEISGPRKPALVEWFRPLGYDCKGESGVFTLRRRTEGNLQVEIHLDVGTWSRSLTGFFEVHGIGFRAVLPLPPSRRAIGCGQYPIGSQERWRQIVENLAALAGELDRTFVPELEKAAGPAPQWFRGSS